MSNARFSDEFKRDAVRQMTERGHPARRSRGALLRHAEPASHGRIT
jgi:transposase-like protein